MTTWPAKHLNNLLRPDNTARCVTPKRKIRFASKTPDGTTTPQDLFEWWSEVIEIPVVAEGALTPETIAALSPFSDFFAIGEEIWNADDPVTAFKALTKAIR